ncbi:MAG: hypothetical protein Q8M15_06125 [Bacteroidota bacterium]|nr:hypothetical protein [Bacteroidota bacterium]
MKTKKLIMALGIISILTGCIPSLNPLYTSMDLIFKSEFLGTWKETKSIDSWTFEQKSDKEYKLTHTEDNKHATFRAHVVKIGEFLFLDLYPEELKSVDHLYQIHFFPVHTFSKIKIINDQLTIEMFDPSWLEKGIESNQINIAHIKSSDGTILLTASTEELQKFVLKYADTKGVFQEPLTLKKN